MNEPGGNAALSPPEKPRHVYGPRPLGALMPAITRPAFKKRAPAAAQIMADWAVIAGPALAAVTQPRRISSGTLTLSCSGPIAMELQHMSAELLARINGHLGRVVAERLRFVQDAPPPPKAAAPARPRPPVDVPGVPPGPLREALAALGQAVAARDDA